MTRSSFVVRTIGLGLLLTGSFACGEAPPPKPPETPAVIDAGETAPAPAEMDAGSAATTPAPETTPPPAPPPVLALPSAAAKVKVKTTKDFDLEVKSDGTVNSGGKPAAKIAGMELQDAAGKTQLKVDAEGTITTGEGAPYAKFDGDTLTTNTGAKYAIGDDGAVKNTPEKGAEKSIGKATDVGSAKRSTLLAVAFVTWGTKAPQPKAAPAAAEKKPADAKAEAKPAEKKPAEPKAADPKAAPKK
jgi:hypothetical protein